MSKIQHLDGLRGLAALWVLIGHCMMLTGFSLPILGKPDLGVDLFIILSGFLMTYQYESRKDHEDWNNPKTWMGFWIRRFFRLSPLYFPLLAVGLLAGPLIYADRALIDTFFGQAPQPPERYLDASATNVIAHLTYVFGLLPSHAVRSPLPDWSLGLEMQFYAVFPFAVLLVRKVKWLAAAVCIVALSLAIAVASRLAGMDFPMPSYLPLKMHIFVAGMLTAAAIGKDKRGFLVLAALFMIVPIGGARDVLHLAVRELILLGFFALIHWRSLAPVGWVSDWLSSPPFRWLGELSYSVYLLHLLILHPVAAWTIGQWGHGLSGAARFGVTIAVVAPITYGLSFFTYMLIERPGQTLGRNLLVTLGLRSQRLQTDAEKIAAP